MATEIRLKAAGAGETTVVLVHGVPGSGAIWSEVARDLSRDHRVVTVDLLGFGASDRPRDVSELWIDAQADALSVALEREGVAGAVLAGHDYGAPVGLRLAGRGSRAVSAIGLFAANAFADTPIPLPIRAVTWPLVGGIAGALLFSRASLRMMLKLGSSVPLDADALLGDREQTNAIATIFAYALRNLDAFAAVERDLRSFDGPLLVGWGQEDPFFAVEQADRTAEAARRSRVSLYPGAGHFLPVERPREVTRDIRQLVGDARRSGRLGQERSRT